MEIHIGQSEHEFISLDVIKRSYDSYDGNWLNVKVIVKAGGFTGVVENQLQANELASFQIELAKLYKSLSGSAKFATLEGWLSFEVVGGGMGGLSCTGEVMDGFVDGNVLNFNLHIDQTFLPEILKSLKEIENSYSIRK